ncbi:MAG: RluA family pseudouridine synthase [Clostridia bacterium]|nr:RluA family pseudouridine synthase [Clostridia bacterium]
MKQLIFTVPPSNDGETIQTFLRQTCGLSWRMVVRLKHTQNGITVGGEHRRTIDRISAGDTLVLSLPEDEVRIEGADIPLSIVYEDESLLVVNKPPYLAVHPSAGKPEPTLANAVVGYYQRQGEACSFRPTNRLDRNTSGLLLAAKNPHIAFALTGKVEKTYLAIVLGNLEGTGTIDQPIRVKEGCCITREVGEGGKESRTHYEALASDGQVTLVRLQLETGRTHQIRVHMSWLGYPLAGDTMYGTDEVVMARHALHCVSMRFSHPLTGERIELTAPLPDDMRTCLKQHTNPKTCNFCEHLL